MLGSLIWVFGLFCLLFVAEGCNLKDDKRDARDLLCGKRLESEKCRFGHLKLKCTNLEKTEI